MKYHKLSIVSDWERNSKARDRGEEDPQYWKILLDKGTEDQEEVKTTPNPIGFYLFPETMPVELAVVCLKGIMIQEIDRKIKRMQKSRLELLDSVLC